MIKTITLLLAIMLVPQIVLANSQPVYVNNLLDALAEAESSNKDILLVFTAGWCPVCQIMKKEILENPSVVEDKIVCYIEYDLNRDLVNEYQVKIIPDYLIMRDRIEIKRKTKYSNLQNFKKWIENE